MKKTFSLLILTVATLAMANGSQAASSSPVLDDYVAVADALANDDLGAAKKAAATLADAAKTGDQSELAKDAAKIASSDSLDAARKNFKLASRVAEKLATGKDGYNVVTCPMAKADWVQKGTAVKNPYLGQSMPDCGSIKNPGNDTQPQAMSMGGCCG